MCAEGRPPPARPLVDVLDHAIVLAPTSPGTIFATTLTEFRTGLGEMSRGAIALIHIAIAATFFPTASVLTDACRRGSGRGRRYPALYTPRNATLITLFSITDDEQRELATIVTREEVKRRRTLREQAKRATAREARREALTRSIVELRDEQKLSWPAIALQVPVSMGNAHALYKAFKNTVVLLGGVGGEPTVQPLIVGG